MSARVDQAAHTALNAATTTIADRARLRSLLLPFAGAWLSAPPSRALGFRLRPREFRLLVRYRLGLPMADAARPCPMCPDTLDQRGLHAASCKNYPGITARHNGVRDALLALAKNAGFSAESETRHLLDHTPALLGRRPADVYIRAWDGAQDMCLDVSVVNPLTKSALDRWPESVVTRTESAKIRESAGPLRVANLLFLPVVMETYGGLGPQAMVADEEGLGKALAHASEDGDEGRAINAVGTKLAFVCQQGLARSFHARYTTLHQHNMFQRMLLGVDEEADEDALG